MTEYTLSSEFYWDNIIVKVEDTLFCVPRHVFVQSSEVFADMFLLPSGPATCSEGQVREHPIVLEGYKKDDFACLLRVMYPTSGSLISGLFMKKEEWVSVLKLSTIWNMKEIRQHAIHRLSNDVILLPIEKILLARAYRVTAWLEEAVISLATCDPKPTLDELATLGWETAARILWIWYNSPKVLDTLCFRRDAINCGHIISATTELTFPGPGSPTSGTAERLIPLRAIQCKTCGGTPFYSFNFFCNSCSNPSSSLSNVRITVNKALKTMVEEMFGEEIKDYEPATIDA